jgi:hypothetical protein
MQVVNRVITVGERAGWGSGGSDGSSGGPEGQQRSLPERWVQFGSVSGAVLEVEEVGAQPVMEAGGLAAGRTLGDYLAVPPEQYSLLDPKWIERCGCSS